ncbi:MAG TPA: cupin domain-containing protein [Candidatus Eremiobacteraceae bacterium]|nr:cupin domain-containing protein [Candidatus Eremiobacteraceae bacterium]
MRKVNTKTVPEDTWTSPKGKYVGADKGISEALGRDPRSTDLMLRHPFDVALMRVPPGKVPFPYHSHSAQWEFYIVESGAGKVRHQDGTDEIEAGDAFIFEPGQPHQLINDGKDDLVVYIIADNPVGESCHYPDSDKYAVRSPGRKLMRSEALGYYDGEE